MKSSETFTQKKALWVYIISLLLLLITYFFYFNQRSGVQQMRLRPLTHWMHSSLPLIAISVLTLCTIILYRIRKHNLIISHADQLYTYFVATILFFLFNPWAFSNIGQLPLSIILSSALFMLSYAVLGRLTFCVWPIVFFLSLLTYSLQFQGITLDSDKLMQIFCTSWQDARFYFTWKNILMAIGALAISIIAWHGMYRRLKHISRFSLFSNGLMLLTPVLVIMLLLKNNIAVNEKYAWPLGCTQQVAYESKQALTSIKKINLVMSMLPSDDKVQASISEENRYDGVICILHVGESVSANHLPINGYNRNTTPWLAQQTTLINFKDCVASAIVTDRAFLTVVTNGRRDILTEQDSQYLPSSPCLVDFFKVSGFKCATFWEECYTNNPAGNLFAKQIEYFNRKADAVYGYSGTNYMQQLKDVYDFTTQNEGCNQFLLINNMGSHAFFEGYDHDNPPFPIPLEPQADFCPKENTEHAESFVNAYDSTIHLTDRYIAGIAEHLKGKPFIYIYMSDHGEYLGDNGYWQRNQVPFEDFHKHAPCMVPFFIYASPEFEEKHPHFKEALNQLRKNQNTSTAHEHLFHTVLGLMNIETPYYDASLDLTKPNVKPYTGPHPNRKGQTLAP